MKYAIAQGSAFIPYKNPLQIRADFPIFSWLRGFGLARLCEGNPVGKTCKSIFSAPIFKKQDEEKNHPTKVASNLSKFREITKHRSL